jgi:F-type H+-transporting ATPase subunit delta
LASESTSASGLGGRYAIALYELADDNKQLDKVAEDLTGLRELIRESEQMRTLLRNPLFSREDKAKAMKAICEKAGVCDLTSRFVQVVARNARLFALPDMIDAYLAELARRRGEVTAHVTAARELSEAQKKALDEALRKAVGAKVKVDLSVDPALLGGLVVKVGSRMIDNSLRNKLQRLQFAMKGVG